MLPTSGARRPVIITIDGPAGTGKSSVAGELARRLGLEFLDTGAMYRAAALLALELNLRPDDGVAIAEALRSARLRFGWGSDRPALFIGGGGRAPERDISERVRDLDVSAIVSIVAGCPEVRGVMVAEQRRLASEHPRLVTEGRDQGSVVFPDAAIRFFLDADPDVRARRRLEQLEAIGKRVEVGVVRDDIARRDRLDAARAEGPLRKPDGAMVVDTTQLTLPEVVARLEREVRQALPRGDFAESDDSEPKPAGAGDRGHVGHVRQLRASGSEAGVPPRETCGR